MSLTVDKYAALDVTIWGDVKLNFQSKLSDSELESEKFNLVTLKIATELEQELATDPPTFFPQLLPITIELDFKNKSDDFEKVKFEFPEVSDPNQLEVLPIQVTNLDEFTDFVNFDGKKTLTIDPNSISSKLVDNSFKLEVQLSNVQNLTGNYTLTVIVQQIKGEDQDE